MDPTIFSDVEKIGRPFQTSNVPQAETKHALHPPRNRERTCAMETAGRPPPSADHLDRRLSRVPAVELRNMIVLILGSVITMSLLGCLYSSIKLGD
jgi:hypothetical protein